MPAADDSGSPFTEQITGEFPSPVETELDREAARFERHLRAAQRSPNTLRSYREAVRLLTAHLQELGMPTDPARVTREHVETFILAQIETHRPATALNRYRSLTVFFNWLVEEGELTASPMARMKPPKVEPDPPAVLGDEVIRKLLKACEGVTFRDRRDAALIRLLLDRGLRREEMATVRMEDIDQHEQPSCDIGLEGRL
jgi:site-specific recombinase XerD